MTKEAQKAASQTKTSPETKEKAKPRGTNLGLTDEQKRNFYLSLARMTYVEAAKALGLSERYTTDNSLRTIAYRLYNEIEPLTLGISKDAIQIVKDALEHRKSKAQELITDGAQPELLDPEDSKQLVIGGKNKAAMLLHKKFDSLMNSKKKLDEVSLSQLATTFGILFDKSQIIRGEATENIAVMARVKNDMTPQESLEALLKMREVDQEVKHG